MPTRLIQHPSIHKQGKRFGLLNGIAVFSNGDLAAIDGDFSTTGVYRMGRSGDVIRHVGSHGLGRYKLKEPVGIFLDTTDTVYVADWHNHRLVVYDSDLRYKEEVGDPSFDQTDSLLGELRSFTSYLSYCGSFLANHFDGQLRRTRTPTRSALVALEGLFHWYRVRGLRGGMRRIHAPVAPMRKPNGAAFLADRVVVSLKNSRNLLLLRRTESQGLVADSYHDCPTPDRHFGRLGNLAAIGGHIFVCDEEQSLIWQLDDGLSLIRTITGIDSGIGKFAPFSCCEVDGFLAVCGGRNIQLFDLTTGELSHCSENFGELHGICYSPSDRTLYVADRSEGAILRFGLGAQ